jgi:hypothetical protein
MALLAVCVLSLLTAEADIALSPLLLVAETADVWFAGVVSVASDARVVSCPVTVAAAGLPRPLAASPTTAIAVLTALAGVGGLIGAATAIAAATGCGGLAAALTAAAAASAVAAPPLLPLSALLPLAEEVFGGEAAAVERIWSGSVGGGTPLVATGFAWESAPTALVFAAALFGPWALALPLVEVLGGVLPPFATGRFGGPTCGVAGPVALPGVAAGFEFGLDANGWGELWLCEGVLPEFFDDGFVGPVFVGAGFVGVGFVDAGLVAPGLVDAELVGAELAGGGLDDAEFAGAEFAVVGLEAGGRFTGAGVVFSVAVASSSAAKGWESVCAAGAAGVGAVDHCDCANDGVELTSDAMLDTG